MFKSAASLIEACLVTEVREYGEIVTAIRLEYDEEVCCRSLTNYICHAQSDYHHRPNEDTIYDCTYHIESSVFYIDAVYCNNSAKKDEAAYYGRYVFLNLEVTNPDPLKYEDYVTFYHVPNCSDPRGGIFPQRPKLRPIRVFQLKSIETRSGNEIASGSIEAYREIRLIIDDFKTFTIGKRGEGHWIDCNLFIPKGYEEKRDDLENLPLLLFYPSGQARFEDYSGNHIGALVNNRYCTVWAGEENQKEHPSFVMTLGGDYPYMDWGDQPDYAHSWVQQYYVEGIRAVCQRYNVDTGRIYGCSSGGGGGALWQTAAANPGLFAAQIIAANDFYSPGGLRDEERGHKLMIEILSQKMNSWWVCEEQDSTGRYALSDTDERLRGDFLRYQAQIARKAGFEIDITDETQMWNGNLRGRRAQQQVQEQIARNPNAHCRISFLIPGTVHTDKHFGGRYFYENKALRDWMYTNRLAEKDQLFR